METKINFEYDNFSKYMSTTDQSKFAYQTRRSSHKNQQLQFSALAKSLRKYGQQKSLSRSKISSQQISTHGGSSKHTKSSTNGIHVVQKLKNILKNQKSIVDNFKEWTQGQKLKVNNQFEGFKLQMNNFIEKQKITVIEYIDKFYIQLLEGYKELQNMARNLYSTKKKQKQTKSKTKGQYYYQNSPQDETNQFQINNYGLISHLQKERQTFEEYNQVKNFYQFHVQHFDQMAKQINRISSLIETDSLKQLTLQCQIKQFQNHLYHSMREINEKIKWDRQPLIQIDISNNN